MELRFGLMKSFGIDGTVNKLLVANNAASSLFCFGELAGWKSGTVNKKYFM